MGVQSWVSWPVPRPYELRPSVRKRLRDPSSGARVKPSPRMNSFTCSKRSNAQRCTEAVGVNMEFASYSIGAVLKTAFPAFRRNGELDKSAA